GRLELLGEHRHVVLAQTHDSRVAHDIDIGSYGVEQHGLLNAAQALARSLDRRLCPSDGVQILKALEQRLSELHRKTARVSDTGGADAGCARARAAGGRALSAGRSPYIDIAILVLEARVGLAAYKRAQACLGESHLLVGRSKPCALSVQDRIDQVGVSQCLF